MRDEVTVSDHMKKLPAAVRPIVQSARRTVKAIAPQAKEIAYQTQPPRSSQSMWKVARYAVGDEYDRHVPDVRDHFLPTWPGARRRGRNARGLWEDVSLRQAAGTRRRDSSRG